MSDECPHGGEHEWERIKTREAQVRAMGHRRLCSKCLTEQIWRLVQEPGPDNAPDLGEWVPAPRWIQDYVDFWTDGIDPINKEGR